MGLDTPFGYIVIASFVLLICVFMIRPLSNIAYKISQQWKQALFIASCVISIGLFTAYTVLKDSSESFSLSFHKGQPTEGQIEMAITYCKEFVLAKEEGRDYHITLEASNYYRPTSEPALWETCAGVFGNNYWKNDISIGNKDGGRMLCDNYRNSDYNSKEVNTWCYSVFASLATNLPGDLPDELPIQLQTDISDDIDASMLPIASGRRLKVSDIYKLQN